MLNADDFGLSPGVNAGILEAADAGSVTSVSVLVNGPGFEDGVARLAAHPLRHGAGLHFNITSGRPVSAPADVPALLGRDGGFAGLGVLARRALAGRLPGDQVARELDAQLARLRDVGVAASHLDSHRHVHALPGVLKPVRRVAAAAGIRWLRRPVEPVWCRGRGGAWKRLVIGAAWQLASRGADPPGAAVRGIGLDGGRRYQAELLALLDALPPGTTEVVLHPGRSRPDDAAFDGYLAQRDAELEVLLSEPLRRRLARGDIGRTRFAAAGEAQ